MTMDENQINNPTPEQEPATDPSAAAEHAAGGLEPEPGEFPDLEDVYEDGIDDIPETTPPPAENAPDSSVNAAIVADLQREIESLKAQLDDRNAQSIRIAADFDNFRRRTQREREELEDQVKCATIMELLPIVDNFERARAQIKPNTEQEMTIHKSYQSVYKQLVDALKRLGVAPMRAEGQPFDPNLHEAVLREPTFEYEEGTVMDELVRGYLLGDRVLRHAMVKVAAEGIGDPPAPDAAAAEAPAE